MDIDKIRALLDELAAFMKQNDLAELEVDMDGADVKLKKAGSPVAPQQIVHHSAPMPAAGGAAAAPAPVSGEPELDPGTLTVTSPMVGTFYRSSKPDADRFCEVGDEVDEDTVVCIIEAMKVMNEIKAEHSGRVTQILVENGEPVEYGEPLFLIAADE
jgi:acetyl-CoA carboxylase biotin carboxyl carrier protein